MTTRVRGVPPGRAGRQWLQHRLATAERGALLLDHKLRLLRLEQQRLRVVLEDTSAEWEQAARHADLWSARAGLLGGRRAFRLAAPTELVDVEVESAHLMGVRYPGSATVSAPVRHESSTSPEGAAVQVAAALHRRALEAAVQHAAALQAIRSVEEELLATRRRVRAVEDRWVPRLRAALDALDVELEEQEHGDAVRRRWAAGGPRNRDGGRGR